MEPRFYQARLKIERAKQHFNELLRRWHAFLQEDFCDIVIQDNPDGGQTLQIASVKALGPEFALAVGDSIHCARSALDYAANEMGRQTSKRLSFPFDETRERLVAEFSPDKRTPCPSCGKGARSGRYTDIEAAFPGIVSVFVDKIAPYKGGAGLLWELNKLDNRDKHRLIIPVVDVHTISDVRTTNAKNSVGRFTMQVRSGKILNVFRSGTPLKIQDKGKPSAEIFLNETGVIEGAALFPTLFKMIEGTTQAIDAIDAFIADQAGVSHGELSA